MYSLSNLFYRIQYNLQHNEEGATAVEYGIMVALIAAVIILVVTELGGLVRDAFQNIVTNLS